MAYGFAGGVSATLLGLTIYICVLENQAFKIIIGDSSDEAMKKFNDAYDHYSNWYAYSSGISLLILSILLLVAICSLQSTLKRLDKMHIILNEEKKNITNLSRIFVLSFGLRTIF